MPCVLDASIIVAWLLLDESSPVAERVVTGLKNDCAFVPAVWWYEIRNALLMSERKRRLKPGQTEMLLVRLGRVRIEIDHVLNEVRLLGLARDHRLTVYDSAYLVLAERRGLPLATLDRALLRAAAAIGIAAL